MRRLAQAILLGGLLLSAPASAHKGKVTRSLFLEATETHLVVLAHISVRGTERRRALVTLADANRDGRLTERERARLRDELAASALFGLELVLGGSKVVLQDAESKLVFAEGKPIEVAVHGKVELPSRVKQVDLRTSLDLQGLELRLLPGRRRLSSPRAARGEKGLLEISVGPGDVVPIAVGASAPARVLTR